MKTITKSIIGACVFFMLGFYVSVLLNNKDAGSVIKVQEDGYGISYCINNPIEYNVYMHNWAMKEYLKSSDSLFFQTLPKYFYLNRSDDKKGLNVLIKKDGSYYECVVFRQERRGYDFDNFYMITPDTIYRITLKPLKFEFDTIR